VKSNCILFVEGFFLHVMSSPSQNIAQDCWMHVPDQCRKKKKRIGIYHTKEGIGHGRQPAGQVEGEQ
jgi:hypothetical protein